MASHAISMIKWYLVLDFASPSVVSFVFSPPGAVLSLSIPTKMIEEHTVSTIGTLP